MSGGGDRNLKCHWNHQINYPDKNICVWSVTVSFPDKIMRQCDDYGIYGYFISFKKIA